MNSLIPKQLDVKAFPVTMLCAVLDILQSHVSKVDYSARKPAGPIGSTYHVDSQGTGRGGSVTAWSGLWWHFDTVRKMSPKAIFTFRRRV